MRIAIFTPGCPPNSSIDWPTRGEGRWSLNWIQVLREEGHEVFQIHDHSSRQDNPLPYDLYLNTPWFQRQACNFNEIQAKYHAHLRYGPVKRACPLWDQIKANHPDIQCIDDGTTNLVFGYKDNYFDSLLEWQESSRKYNIGLMPIPFSQAMFPHPISDPFTRPGIAWMSKEIFHADNLKNRPWFVDIGIWFLRALVKLRQKAQFTLYMLSNPREDLPGEVKTLLSQLDVRTFDLLPFTSVLALMSNTKLTLGIAGTASCTIDALFRRATPLGHYKGFMSDTLMREEPSSLLPLPTLTKEEDIYPRLEKMWFDRRYYNMVSDCYQEEFSCHRKENAMRYFGRFMEDLVCSQ